MNAMMAMSTLLSKFGCILRQELVDWYHEKQHLTLTADHRSTLETLLSKGTLSARKFKRATALLELDRGKTLQAVATTLDVTYNAVASWRDGYKATGLNCLDDAARSGRPTLIDGAQRAKITALACSDAPEAHDRWTLRLLAEKVVEAGFCDHVSHTLVGNVVKKRTETPPPAQEVLWHTRCGLPGKDGAHSGTLCPALRPSLSSDLFR